MPACSSPEQGPSGILSVVEIVKRNKADDEFLGCIAGEALEHLSAIGDDLRIEIGGLLMLVSCVGMKTVSDRFEPR